MPQKNPFGKVTPDDVSKSCAAALAGAAAMALDDPLHAENVPGSPAAAPAPSIDCRNLRRVRRKLGWISFTNRMAGGGQWVATNPNAKGKTLTRIHTLRIVVFPLIPADILTKKREQESYF